MGAVCLSLICYALLYVHSSFAIILKRKRKLVAWPFSYRCLVTQYCKCSVALLTVLCVGLQCVIVVFPDHTHSFSLEACYFVF